MKYDWLLYATSIVFGLIGMYWILMYGLPPVPLTIIVALSLSFSVVVGICVAYMVSIIWNITEPESVKLQHLVSSIGTAAFVSFIISVFFLIGFTIDPIATPLASMMCSAGSLSLPCDFVAVWYN